MRMMFGVLGLLAALAIVGLLARKQMGAGVAPAVPVLPGASAGAPAMTPAATPQQQVQQFKDATEAALQQPRTMPEDK